MDQPADLDIVREFLLENGGIIRNVDLVRHFRKFLQPEDSTKKDVNRESFKSIVNSLAAVRSEGGEKYIILKSRYYPSEWGGALPGLIRSSLSPSSSSRYASNPDIRAPSPTKPYKSSVHIPGVTVPHLTLAGGNSDNESEVMTSLSTISLDSQVLSRTNNSHIKVPQLQNGGKPTFRKQPKGDTLDDRQTKLTGPPGIGFMVNVKSEASSSTPSMHSEEREETSSISTSFSAFDYDLMDPLEHEWMMAAVQNNNELVQQMVDSDSNLVHKKDFVMGYTALHWAAIHGNDQMLSTLLLNGSEVNTRSIMGSTALHLAAQRGHDHIIQLLVAHYGASTTIRDNSGRRPCDVGQRKLANRSRDLLSVGMPSPVKQKKKKKKKSRSFSGSLPSLNRFSTDETLEDEDFDGSSRKISFKLKSLTTFRRTWSIRKNDNREKRSGSVNSVEWTE